MNVTSGVHFLSKVFSNLSKLVILIMMLTTCYDVMMRYLFASPTTWSVELNAMFLVFVTFFGSSELVREDTHIQMNALFNRLSPERKTSTEILISILVFLFCIFLFWIGGKATITVYHSGIFTSGTFRLPMWIPYMSIPVGSFLMALEYLLRIINLFTHCRRYKLWIQV